VRGCAGEDPVTTSERQVVEALEQAIIQRVTPRRYKLWFEGHSKFTWEEGQLVVGVPNLHFQEWLKKKFAGEVHSAAAEVFDRPMDVHFAIDPGLFQAARREQADCALAEKSQTATLPPSEARKSQAAPSPAGRTPLGTPVGTPRNGLPMPTRSPADERPLARSRRWHRLGDFVVGACNRVAHASALSVVEAPGQGPNPLVLHGPVGTGKSHLLEGIYVGLRKAHPDWRVSYVTAEDFTNRFVQSMRFGKLTAFRKQYRDADALLLDDLHFLAGKKATQEEFLHTFDSLQRDGKQLVVSCDCHPKLSDDLAPELTDRLLGGAIWGLTPPDVDTRLDLLRAKSFRPNEPPIPEPVLLLMAERLRGNVRELEGALHSLRHYARVAGRPVDLPLAREALADLLRHAVRVVRPADIDAAVCKVLRLDPGALQAKARTWAVSHPRMLAMFLARKHTAASYTEVGEYFGGRNHSTAVAAEKKIRQWIEADAELSLGESSPRVRAVVELVERELSR
jgi:chromosomal replication initiator protein